MNKLSGLLILWLAYLPLLAQPVKLPHLIKSGEATQLVVKGKPFLVRGGELHNSSTSGAAYMRPIWSQMKKKNLNTVIAPAYWELVEPQENKFDFALVDSLVYGARKQDLHVILLWFGSWKNGYSMYAPGWVKNNPEKYPRVQNSKGESFVVLSALSQAAASADAKAFKRLMQHIRQIDEKEQTVIMVQVENEVGLFYEPRDHSEVATTAYNKGVPADLLTYLSANKGKLQPELDSAWKANGYRTAGSWEAVFGKSTLFPKTDWKALSYLPEELFTVYHYADYIGQVAAAGKAAYPIPMYVNAWIKQPIWGSPGKYPSGGPVPHTLDIWRLKAPAIDFIAPDIYAPIPVARYIIEQYHRPGNLVFIPEFKPDAPAANLALWAIGEHDLACFSPFGIDESLPQDDPITKTYAALAPVQDLILQHQGKGTMRGIYVDTLARAQTIELNGYRIDVALVVPTTGSVGGEVAGLVSSSRRATSGGGIIIATGAEEFIVLGKDFRLSFTPLKVAPQKPKLDVEYMDEGTFVKGKWQTTRRLNGDEGTGGGDYGFGFSNGKKGTLRLQNQPNDAYNLVRLKFYRY